MMVLSSVVLNLDLPLGAVNEPHAEAPSPGAQLATS